MEPQDLNDPALRDRAVRAARGREPFESLIEGGMLVDVATGDAAPRRYRPRRPADRQRAPAGGGAGPRTRIDAPANMSPRG